MSVSVGNPTKWLSVQEAADHTGVSRATVHRLAKRGIMPFFRPDPALLELFKAADRVERRTNFLASAGAAEAEAALPNSRT